MKNVVLLKKWLSHQVFEGVKILGAYIHKFCIIIIESLLAKYFNSLSLIFYIKMHIGVETFTIWSHNLIQWEALNIITNVTFLMNVRQVHIALKCCLKSLGRAQENTT